MKKLRSKMKLSERASSWRSSEPRIISPAIAVICCCLLLPTVYLMNFRHSFSFLTFEPSVRLSLQMQVVDEEDGGAVQSVKIIRRKSADTNEKERTEELLNRSIKPGNENRTSVILASSTKFHPPLPWNSRETESSSSHTLSCDTSHERFDTCFLQGDVRIISNASKLLLVVSSSSPTASNNTWKIRPYPRKWEAPVMDRIKELSIVTSSETPRPLCTVNHTSPALIFSTGGFSGNFFHAMTDILIPLYVTSHHFGGEVKFLVSDFSSKFAAKYQPLLTRLSSSELVNLDSDIGVHCFHEVHLGLANNKEFGIDSTKPPSGSSMAGFRDLLRSSFSLKRKRIARKGSRKPRLMIQLRKGSRELVNSREVISMSKKLGFKVVVAGPEDTKNMTSYSSAVNSVDALLGVHGAGLTNMVFLPEGAAVIQIIPWGGLKWACRFSYGDPAEGMGLKYFEYEIKEEESSLIEQYPRNHSVFTNPAEIHKQGWNMLWYVFLEKQKVKVDVKRLFGWRSTSLGSKQLSVWRLKAGQLGTVTSVVKSTPPA